jgi:hypothetical protein
MANPLHNLRLTPVDSSNIKGVGHHPETNMLVVEFTSGAKYSYPGVTAHQAAALQGAESVGQHFARHIRPHFTGQKL